MTLMALPVTFAAGILLRQQLFLHGSCSLHQVEVNTKNLRTAILSKLTPTYVQV